MNKSLLQIAFTDDDADDHLLFFKAVRTSFRVPVIETIDVLASTIEKFIGAPPFERHPALTRDPSSIREVL